MLVSIPTPLFFSIETVLADDHDRVAKPRNEPHRHARTNLRHHLSFNCDFHSLQIVRGAKPGHQAPASYRLRACVFMVRTSCAPARLRFAPTGRALNHSATDEGTQVAASFGSVSLGITCLLDVSGYTRLHH